VHYPRVGRTSRCCKFQTVKFTSFHRFSGADEEFRTTLTDPQFVNFLQNNDFITWGGDIRDKEAWSSEFYFPNHNLNNLLHPSRPQATRHDVSVRRLRRSSTSAYPCIRNLFLILADNDHPFSTCRYRGYHNRQTPGPSHRRTHPTRETPPRQTQRGREAQRTGTVYARRTGSRIQRSDEP